MRKRISNGTLVTPAGRLRADLLIDGERIAAIIEPGSRVTGVDGQLDATGKLVFPGFIDPHVHSRDPGLTDKETFAHSTAAAAAGGITTLIEMPNAVPPVADLASLRDRAAQHTETAFIDFGLWGLSLGDANLDQVAPMIAGGAAGVKLFWGYALNRRTRALVYNAGDEPAENLLLPPDNGQVYSLFREVAKTGGLLAAHCEDRGVLDASERALGHPITSYEDLLAARPDAAEAAAIATAVEFARATGCRFHVVHVSSRRGVEVIRQAKAAGIAITAETCPQYLTLTDADAAQLGARMKVYPPVRRAGDRDALLRAVTDGTIDSIGSDHAPHTVEQKRLNLAEAPAGAAGVETTVRLMLDLMFRGHLSPERLAAVLSESTARIYGLHPRKGSLLPGTDADVTIVDPEATWTIDERRLHSKHRLSPWAGRSGRGTPVAAVLRGMVVMRDGEPLGEPAGRFIESRPAPGVPESG